MRTSFSTSSRVASPPLARGVVENEGQPGARPEAHFVDSHAQGPRLVPAVHRETIGRDELDHRFDKPPLEMPPACLVDRVPAFLRRLRALSPSKSTPYLSSERHADSCMIANSRSQMSSEMKIHRSSLPSRFSRRDVCALSISSWTCCQVTSASRTGPDHHVDRESCQGRFSSMKSMSFMVASPKTKRGLRSSTALCTWCRSAAPDHPCRCVFQSRKHVSRAGRSRAGIGRDGGARR